MIIDSKTVDAEQTLFGNLLDEQLLRYRRTTSGERIAATLPELFVAMTQDLVRDFPALRPHQRHPWHAFLVQLATIALHHAGHVNPFSTAGEWRAALLALTPDDPDGAAWCLVSPINRPAFLQSPVLPRLELEKKGNEKIVDYDQWEKLIAADLIDVVKASKNHDLKKERISNGGLDDWIFSIVSLQSQCASDSGSYKQSVRVAGGYGRRPAVGISTNHGFGARWRRDLEVALEMWEPIARDCELDGKGTSLVWLLPWNGTEIDTLPASRLAPFFLENSRRIRFEMESSKLIAKTDHTPNTRIHTNGDGKTGDIWSPIKLTEKMNGKAGNAHSQEQVFTGGFKHEVQL
jgi:CRISPR system Cascade subunit CasA